MHIFKDMSAAIKMKTPYDLLLLKNLMDQRNT